MQPEDLIALNEEIAGMARAGLPLDQGLAALARDMGRGKLRNVTVAIAEDLRTGRTLPEALTRQGSNVPPYYADLVTAGVRTGRVGDVLATLTVYARTISGLRALVVDALFYPAVVLVFAAALAGVFCYYILPQFDQVFRSFNIKLPALTEWAFRLSRDPFYFLILPPLAVLGVVTLLALFLGLTPRGRRARARLLYAVPVLGTLIRSARLAAFTDLLAILVDHETPLPDAFRLAGGASSDPVMVAATRDIYGELGEGRPLGSVLQGRGLVPEWVSWMVGLGEQRGTLGNTLHQIAEMYRRQVEMRAALLRSVLPPFLVVITAGLFVVLFVFVMILPMLQLIEGLSK
jgi:type II secretory pathway component PulF